MFPVFQLEDYLVQHEHKATVSLCSSGLEAVTLSELLPLADSESRHLWERLSLDYTPPMGLPQLRTEISRQYEGLNDSQVCVFAGAAEAIQCTFQALLTPADHVVVIVPCYQSLESIPASLCEITRVPLIESRIQEEAAEPIPATPAPFVLATARSFYRSESTTTTETLSAPEPAPPDQPLTAFSAMAAMAQSSAEVVETRSLYAKGIQTVTTEETFVQAETVTISEAANPEPERPIPKKATVSSEPGWRVDLAAVEAAIRPNTKMLVMNFPNNPTGAIPDRFTFFALIELARKHDLYLLSDEVYRLMEQNPADRLPPMVEVYERGLSIASMSKPYGLPGLRIGWLACRDPEILEQALSHKHYLSICPNTPGEVLALMALRAQGRILETNRAIMRMNLESMDTFFRNHADVFAWQRPQGGCLGFPRLLTGESADAFALRLLEAEQVLVLPGSLYLWEGDHLRVSFARRSMPEALARLERFLKTEAVS